MTFGGQWHIFPIRCQPPCSGRFASLGNHPSLAIRNVATVEVARATCPTVLANCARNFANLSRDLYGLKMVLHIEKCSAKKVKPQNGRYRPDFRMQCSFVLCMGSSAFLIADVTFRGQRHVFPVRCHPARSGNFAILVLPLGTRPSETISLEQKASCARITTLGLLVSLCHPSKNRSYIENCALPKKRSGEVHQFSECNPALCLCMGSSAFLIVDLTFHGQWHVYRVRRQPAHSCEFACPANHPSLATRHPAI